MKWIGQLIYDQIARFRDDVYLEDISTGTIASGSNLGLDSNNKIVKATSTSHDEVTLAGTPDYITLSGQEITRNAIDLTADVTGALPVGNGGTGRSTLLDGAILLGDGTNGIRTTGVLGDGEIIIGDGTTDPVTLDVGSSTAITTLGTISTGVWNGTAIASAYLDADTAHYSAQKQLTYYHFQADINTDKIYISLQESDAESATATNKQLPILAPVAGKLLKIFLRANTDISSKTLTWRLETVDTSTNTSSTPSGTFGTQSGAGPTNQTMATYDFTSSLDAGSNVIAAGDTVQISVQADSDPGGNIKYYITCLWEWDLS